MITAIRAEAQALVGDVATVTLEDHGADVDWTLEVLEVRPANPRARSLSVVQLGDELIVGIGEHGGRWEVSADDDGVEFTLALLRACIAGRVTERFGPGRSKVMAVLDDGTVASETGYSGPHLYPLPGWRRWGRLVSYEAYADAGRDRPAKDR